MKDLLIGGHVSIAGGIEHAPGRASEQTFNALQMFVTSPRSFKTISISDDQIKLFRDEIEKYGIQKVFLHAIYLVNLGTDKKEYLQVSINSLVHYLKMGNLLGAVGTVVHLGTDVYFKNTIYAIKEVLKNTPHSQKLIVENAATVKKLGSDIEELIEIKKAVNSERLTFCVDTQHLFASGVNICDREVCGAWLKEFDQKIGLESLSCLHLNDSKTECGSNHDRHENIGEGKIGGAGIRSFLENIRDEIPLILETPGFSGKGPDKENADILRKMLQ